MGWTDETDDDVVVLVCPEAARPGQQIFFRDRGDKCKTTVPGGVRPGQKFTVKHSDSWSLGKMSASRSTIDLHSGVRCRLVRHLIFLEYNHCFRDFP